MPKQDIGAQNTIDWYVWRELVRIHRELKVTPAVKRRAESRPDFDFETELREGWSLGNETFL